MVRKCPSDLPVISDMNMLIINYYIVKKIFRFKISFNTELFSPRRSIWSDNSNDYPVLVIHNI